MNSDVSVKRRVSVNSLRFSRLADAPDCALRAFDAVVELADEATAQRARIGTVGGWLGWVAWLPELADNRDAISGVPEVMAVAAVDIAEDLARLPDTSIEAVLLVETIEVDAPWRGTKLGRRIAEQLIDLLLLAPETTLVVTRLDRPPGVYHAVGFEQWRDSGVWWARMGTPTPEV